MLSRCGNKFAGGLLASALFAIAGLSTESVLLAQAGAGSRGNAAAAMKNPQEGDPEAIRAGTALYKTRCASCHGTDARGAAGGGDLSRLWAAAGFGRQPDQQLFQTIRRGYPNTLKPHSFGPDNDIWGVLAYLRNLDIGPPANPSGDAGNGARIFDGGCASCHQVNGHGGHLGPDLSQIGSNRSRTALAHKVRHASSYIMAVYTGGYLVESYQPVTLVRRGGQRIRGVKKNEDAFSIQIMDSSERLQGFLKSGLREVVNDDASLMPDFTSERVSDRDLEDLLAYLVTLRAAPPAANQSRR